MHVSHYYTCITHYYTSVALQNAMKNQTRWLLLFPGRLSRFFIIIRSVALVGISCLRVALLYRVSFSFRISKMKKLKRYPASSAVISFISLNMWRPLISPWPFLFLIQSWKKLVASVLFLVWTLGFYHQSLSQRLNHLKALKNGIGVSLHCSYLVLHPFPQP